MLITKELLDIGKSANGGWSDDQLELLGVPRCPKGKKWYKRLMGKSVPDSSAKLFIELKNHHLKDNKTKTIIETEEEYDKLVEHIKKEHVPFNKQYEHPNWQKKRLHIMKRDGFKCMICGANDIMLHVHHNTYDGEFIWSCNDRSMITLCSDCHSLYHNNKKNKNK